MRARSDIFAVILASVIFAGFYYAPVPALGQSIDSSQESIDERTRTIGDILREPIQGATPEERMSKWRENRQVMERHQRIIDANSYEVFKSDPRKNRQLQFKNPYDEPLQRMEDRYDEIMKVREQLHDWEQKLNKMNEQAARRFIKQIGDEMIDLSPKPVPSVPGQDLYDAINYDASKLKDAARNFQNVKAFIRQLQEDKELISEPLREAHALRQELREMHENFTEIVDRNHNPENTTYRERYKQDTDSQKQGQKDRISIAEEERETRPPKDQNGQDHPGPESDALSDGYTDKETGTDVDTDSDIGIDPDTAVDPDSDVETDADIDGDPDVDSDANGDSENDANDDSDTGVDTDTAAETDTDIDADTDPDSGVGVDTGTEVDADADADNNFDARRKTNRDDDSGSDAESDIDTDASTDTTADAQTPPDTPAIGADQPSPPSAEGSDDQSTTIEKGHVQDSKGRITVTETRDSQGNLISVTHTTTDSQGNVIEKTEYKEGRGEGKTTRTKNDVFDPRADRNIRKGTPWGGENVDMAKVDKLTEGFAGGVPDRQQTASSTDLPGGGITRPIPDDYASDFTMTPGRTDPVSSAADPDPGSPASTGSQHPSGV
ncbi:MAG TPA: hypothetical protein ENN39_13200, partial [Desulfonatronum sp.]|nr:hypothetical protein [Desulfonatronum sp.]